MRAISKHPKIAVVWLLTLIPFALFLAYSLIFTGRIYPNITVAGIKVGKLKPEEAVFLLSDKVKAPEKIKLTTENQSFDLNAKDIELSYDFVASTQRSFEIVRTGNIIYDTLRRIELLIRQKNIGLSTKLNEESLAKIVSVISGQVSQDPIEPSAKVVDGEIIVQKGSPGTSIDTDLLRALIGEALSNAKADSLEIPLKSIDPSLSEKEVQEFKERSEKYLGKTLQVKFEFNTYNYSTQDILKLLGPKMGYKDEAIKKVIFKITSEINRGPQNPKFSFENGKVSEFLPAKDGIELDAEKFKVELAQNLDVLANSSEKSLSFDTPVIRTPPEVTTDKVNNLGINELIGRGTSRFRGSIPSRIHNITVASGRLNGVLIKPGETLSFNDVLGDVSAFTGYQQAYVIKEGKTVLGDGGGVCQVSTTLFRAAMNTGLPIQERQAHAYRVGYYEQDSGPGLDATVYGPSPDLKIKNDTPAHILIQTKVDPKTYSLVFELYGTSDGRVATVSKPVISNIIPPPDDLYIDDPTLPSGTIKQTEHKASGAKVVFNYKVERGGEVVYKKTFISNYRPWQAVYLRGIGSASN